MWYRPSTRTASRLGYNFDSTLGFPGEGPGGDEVKAIPLQVPTAKQVDELIKRAIASRYIDPTWLVVLGPSAFDIAELPALADSDDDDSDGDGEGSADEEIRRQFHGAELPSYECELNDADSVHKRLLDAHQACWFGIILPEPDH